MSVLLGGAFSSSSFDTETGEGGTFLDVTDLRATADGGVSVVIARQQGSKNINTVSNANGRLLFSKGELSIKSRTLSAAGVVNPQTVYSWTLRPASTNDDGFVPLSATGDGTNVAVIGEQFKAYENAGQFSFRLTPGVRPMAAAFAVNGVPATRVVRDAGGYFYASSGSSIITKLNSRLAPVTAFGLRGSTRVGDTVNLFVPYDPYRVLALADESILRLI